MAKFYVTYGLEGQPYVGGWTLIEAPDLTAAEHAFQAFHPSVDGNFLNCCSIYTENYFVKTSMYKNGNFGARQHEVIRLICEKEGEK